MDRQGLGGHWETPGISQLPRCPSSQVQSETALLGYVLFHSKYFLILKK
jgi:hypothetical protein